MKIPRIPQSILKKIDKFAKRALSEFNFAAAGGKYALSKDRQYPIGEIRFGGKTIEIILERESEYDYEAAYFDNAIVLYQSILEGANIFADRRHMPKMIYIKRVLIHELAHSLQSRTQGARKNISFKSYISRPDEIMAELTAIRNVCLPHVLKHPKRREALEEALNSGELRDIPELRAILTGYVLFWIKYKKTKIMNEYLKLLMTEFKSYCRRSKRHHRRKNL